MEGKRFIRSLRVENFLSYGSEGEEIELQPLNVLIGANASGKSNLIEAIGLLKATPTDLPAPIRQGGGISDFLWKGQQGIPVADILHHSQQGKRNRVSKRRIKGFSFNYLQETRFLVVVQDVR